MQEKWIWLPENDVWRASCEFNSNGDYSTYSVVSFRKNYDFRENIVSLKLRFSADTFFRLYCNGKFIATGPALIGGDFLNESIPFSSYYSTETDFRLDDMCKNGRLEFYAIVRKCPVKINEFSRGRGGFYLEGNAKTESGKEISFSTDETWISKPLNAYFRPCEYDENLPESEELNAALVENIWNTKTANIPPREEKEILPVNGATVCLGPNETKACAFEFDMIYAGFIRVTAEGPVRLKLKYFETDECICNENITLIKNREYIGIDFQSAGRISAEITDLGGGPNRVRLSFIATCYPVGTVADTFVSDNELNEVLKVCAHSLKYCRQTMHLDSPKHCEPLACTGDYYIETLMTAFTFGDMRLSVFDVRRTAEILRFQDGRMFHTTYSLIWVLMLWDVYKFTGEKSLLTDCEDALGILLKRFKGYIGPDGLIDTPPNYMFIDWLCFDGIDLHHPPKALGQTCLNLFYYGALVAAQKIYTETGLTAKARECKNAAEAAKAAIVGNLWDSERGLFFEGLNTPTPENLINQYMPENIGKRYYRKHANVLAAYFKIFDKDACGNILEKVMNDDSLGQLQPYFMHFLLDAVYRNGLRDKYTLKILDMWKKPVADCPKGLPEGFYAPNEYYKFDHSHAWAGTPVYALPLALTGLEIVKEGCGKIRLNPSLCGLDFANVEIPVFYGKLVIRLDKMNNRGGLAVRILNNTGKNIDIEVLSAVERQSFELNQNESETVNVA